MCVEGGGVIVGIEWSKREEEGVGMEVGGGGGREPEGRVKVLGSTWRGRGGTVGRGGCREGR